jgi:transposase-like protein
MRCKKCGSDKVVKNGTTRSGRQQYHCRDCGVYTTTDAYAKDYAAKLGQVDLLHQEGMSQSAIARVVGISRPTIIGHLKKKPSARSARR